MYFLECFKCGKEFEAARDYTRRCPECRVKKPPAKEARPSVTCKDCGYVYKIDKCPNCNKCLECGKVIIRKTRWGYSSKKYCDECRDQVSNYHRTKIKINF